MLKWQLIEIQILRLTLRLSFFDKRGLIMRYCLLRHFQLDKLLNPKLITSYDRVDTFANVVKNGNASFK